MKDEKTARDTVAMFNAEEQKDGNRAVVVQAAKARAQYEGASKAVKTTQLNLRSVEAAWAQEQTRTLQNSQKLNVMINTLRQELVESKRSVEDRADRYGFLIPTYVTSLKK
jgi:hypothetical protein